MPGFTDVLYSTVVETYCSRQLNLTPKHGLLSGRGRGTKTGGRRKPDDPYLPSEIRC